MSPRKLKIDPEIVRLEPRTMAVVNTVGDPNDVGERVFPALYGAVYGLKFALKKQGVEFKVEPPRARWFAGEGWQQVPREEWRAAWAIPVPDGTRAEDLPQKLPDTPVVIEHWAWGDGTVAQILHLGAYSEEVPTIERLHAFIAEQGYEIGGDHEEEYLSRPGAKVMKTIVRYPVRPKA